MRLVRKKHKHLCLSQVLAKCSNNNSAVEVEKSDDEIKSLSLVHTWIAQRKQNLNYPILVKKLSNSHLVTCQMRLPKHFCKKHLGGEDTNLMVEIGNGEHYRVKYSPRLPGLCGGWRRFVIDNNLVAGDLLIFRLVESTKFKASIIRASTSTVTLPVPLDYPRLCAQASQDVADDNQINVYKRREFHLRPQNSTSYKSSKTFKLVQKDICFKKVKKFEYLNNIIEELLQDNVLPEFTLQSYYKLCCREKAFLHAHLLEGLNPRVFVSAFKTIISKIVNLATVISTCTLSSFLENYSKWDEKLQVFECYGMNISSLRAHLHRLENLAVDSEGADSRGRYIEASNERGRCEIQVMKLEAIFQKARKVSVGLGIIVKNLESKSSLEKYLEAYSKYIQIKDEVKELETLLTEFRNFFEYYDAVIETLKLKANDHELRFQEEVCSFW